MSNGFCCLDTDVLSGLIRTCLKNLNHDIVGGPVGDLALPDRKRSVIQCEGEWFSVTHSLGWDGIYSDGSCS